MDAERVLVAGPSEGAVLAAALAARGVPLAGVVLLSGSATPGEQLLRWQTRQIAPTLPRPARAIMRLFRVDLEKKVAAHHARIKATTTDVARIGGAKLNARWIAVPVPALTGGKDPQVSADDLDVIAATVPEPVEVRRVPELSHTLRRQPGPASLGAYGKELREPVDAGVLAAVVGFARRVTGLDG